MQRHIDEVDASDSQVGGRFKVSEGWSSVSRLGPAENEGAKLSPDEAVARHNALLDHPEARRNGGRPLRE